MEDKVNYTVVGVFVLVLGAALIAGVLWLAAGGSGKKHYDEFRAVMTESVAGLNVDAPVKYLGVDVGKVREISIDPANPGNVQLQLLIERGTPIKQDTEAVLRTQGLTGIAYVELGGGTPGSPPLVATESVPVPTIPTRPSLATRLEADMATVLASLNRTTAAINATLDADNRAALKKTLASTAALMQSLATQQAVLAAGIADAARTARNAAVASEQLAPALARIATAADSVSRMADEVGRAGGSVDRLGERVGRLADSAASGVQQMRTETLPDIAGLVAELSLLAVSLRHLSEQTERQPTSLLVGMPVPAPGPGEKARP